MTLDAHAAELIAGLQAQGLKAFEHSTVQEVRAVVATFAGLQAPPEPVARVEDAHYESGGAQIALRVYVPEGRAPHPSADAQHDPPTHGRPTHSRRGADSSAGQ